MGGAGLYGEVGLEPEGDGLEGSVVGRQLKVGGVVAGEVEGVPVHPGGERGSSKGGVERDVVAIAAGVEDQLVRRVGLELVVGEESVLGFGGNQVGYAPLVHEVVLDVGPFGVGEYAVVENDFVEEAGFY